MIVFLPIQVKKTKLPRSDNCRTKPPRILILHVTNS